MAETRSLALALTIACVGVCGGACGQEPATCPENLSIDISNIGLNVFNGVVNGTTGSVSKSFTCSTGGGGSLTGTAGNGMYDLTFVFNGCVSIQPLGTITLTGSLHHQNTFATHVETGHADALTISGSESSCTADPINATCVVDWSFAGQDASNVPIGSGSVCGLTFP